MTHQCPPCNGNQDRCQTCPIEARIKANRDMLHWSGEVKEWTYGAQGIPTISPDEPSESRRERLMRMWHQDAESREARKSPETREAAEESCDLRVNRALTAREWAFCVAVWALAILGAARLCSWFYGLLSGLL